MNLSKKKISRKKTKEEESVDDPLTIHQEIENRNVCDDIKEELKEGEENVENQLSFSQKDKISNFIEDIKEEIKEEKESLEDTLTNKQELGQQQHQLSNIFLALIEIYLKRNKICSNYYCC